MNRVFLLLTMSCLGTLAVQGQGIDSTTIRQLQSELRSLRELIETRSISPDLEFDSETEMLEERIEARFQELESKIDGVSRTVAPVIFNPRITAFLNVAGRLDDRAVLDSEEETRIDDRAYVRTIEMDFRAPVDPYAEAVVILALEDEAGQAFAIEPEEAYGVLRKLPILESAPWGMKLKIGKFRPPVGSNNKLHMHDLPWTTRPLLVSRYFGSEHGNFFESGYNPVGIDAEFYLPNPIPGTTLELNADLLNTGGIAVARGRVGNQPATLGHLTLSKDWRNEHMLSIGGTAYYEGGLHSTGMFGADLLYKYAPAEMGKYTSFVLGGEWYGFALRSPIQNDQGMTVEGRSYPQGFFTYAQYQPSFRTYLGIRYDRIEEPFDEEAVTTSIGGFVSYYTTEFVRFRMGIERMGGSALPDPVTTGLFEVNFVFGSHPTEPYWVSR